MKAPEKIYLEAIYPDNGVLPNGLNYTPSPTDIEYIRTDAFIKKACEFLSKLSNYNEGFIYPSHSGVIDSFVNNFKNYMEGE